MDKDQIRKNLSGYRPELYHDDDPAIAESLRLAKTDPELSAWLQEQIDFDRRVSDTMTSLLPPAGAKESLLEGYRSHQLPRPARRLLPGLAVAAALVISTALVAKYFLMPPPVEFASHPAPTVEVFREQMAFFASQRFVLDQTFDTNAESALWLAEQNYPTIEEIPGKLVNFRGMGCKKFDWQNNKVGLICFRKSSNEIVHLFVLERTALTADKTNSRDLDELHVFHGRQTKGWEDQNHVYLLVGSQPGVEISGIL